MRFEVLGPLRALAGDREIAVTAARERAVLATLLLHTDRAVPVDLLAEAVWSGAPPRSARNQLQACVSRLRQRLARAGLPGEVIATEPAGYRLRVDPEQVDVHRFRGLATQARAAAVDGRRDEASDRYRAALELWRGPALAGDDSPALSRAASALEEERAQVLQECFVVELALGRSGELIGELTELVQRYPYREALHAVLMRALYRAGRPADALAAFRRARQRLHDELGTEPGEELQQLHQAILNRDPLLGAAAPASVPGGGGGWAWATASVPHELPAEASCFVGRAPEIDRVRGVLVPANPDARRPPVVVLYGPGGVGKSALAVRVAHELAGEFPDGQLYVDLCGSTPGMRPLPATEVLGRFLRRLGVAPDQVPPSEAEAAALFRSVTAERRLLLVLDNAADKDQVAALVPAAPGCAALVTSRYPLPTLDAEDRLRIEVLDGANGLALLAGLAGGRASDGDAAQSIVSLSGGLPLAIRVAAGRLASRPDLPATEYAQRLADGSRRLDELQLDDLAVRACIRTGYDALLSDGGPAGQLAARAFRMLGVLHVPDVAPGVVAAMLGEPDVETARAALDRLVDAQLVEPLAGGRYRLHDLVRLVATELATAEDPPATRDAAITRAITFYTGRLWSADRVLRPTRTRPFGEPSVADGVRSVSFESPDEARIWIDDEVGNLVPALERAVAAACINSRLLLWLSDALWMALDIRCEWHSAHMVSQLTLAAAERRSDGKLNACGLMLLGRSWASLGDFGMAKVHLERARAALQHMDNQSGMALVLNGLGVTETRRGAYAAALSHYIESLDLAERHGLVDMIASVLNNMSVCYAWLGQLDRALTVAKRSAAISAEKAVRASVLLNLSAIQFLQGNHTEAVQCVGKASELGRKTGDRRVECESLIIRSEMNLQRGKLDEADADADQALVCARASGYTYAAASARRQRAKILAVGGRESEATRAGSAAAEALYDLTSAFRDPMVELLLRGGQATADSSSVVSEAC